MKIFRIILKILQYETSSFQFVKSYDLVENLIKRWRTSLTILSVHSFNLTVATGVFPFYLTSDWLSCHVITHYRIELTIDKIVDIVFRKQSIWYFCFYLKLLFKNWYLYEDLILNTMLVKSRGRNWICQEFFVKPRLKNHRLSGFYLSFRYFGVCYSTHRFQIHFLIESIQCMNCIEAIYKLAMNKMKTNKFDYFMNFGINWIKLKLWQNCY